MTEGTAILPFSFSLLNSALVVVLKGDGRSSCCSLFLFPSLFSAPRAGVRDGRRSGFPFPPFPLLVEMIGLIALDGLFSPLFSPRIESRN